MATAREKTLMVFDPVALTIATQGIRQTAGFVEIPIEKIKRNMEAMLANIGTLFRDANRVLGPTQLSYIDLSLAIAVNGSVGVGAWKLGGEAKGGITIRLTPKRP